MLLMTVMITAASPAHYAGLVCGSTRTDFKGSSIKSDRHTPLVLAFSTEEENVTLSYLEAWHTRDGETTTGNGAARDPDDLSGTHGSFHRQNRREGVTGFHRAVVQTHGFFSQNFDFANLLSVLA